VVTKSTFPGLATVTILKMEFNKLIENITRKHSDLQNQLKSILIQQNALEQLGLDYGKPSYKKGVYLRITKPMVKGQKRVQVYIGNDPQKIKTALAAIDRAARYDKLEEKRQVIECRLKRFLDNLNYA
jgi:hypothetical protein